ncbi:hypothetical protein L1887_60436 [Cichorium endivia]|nr:hypothetical protein L1887_60436 [Cichorium endivia]
MDATLWAASWGKSDAYSGGAFWLPSSSAFPVGIAMGLSPTVRGILDPLIELYPPRCRRWPGCRWWREERPAGADPRGAVAGGQPHAGAAVRDFTGRAAEILTGLRIGLGVGWSTLVAAELIAATRGLGFMVQSAGEFLATDVVLAGIAAIRRDPPSD